MEAGAVEGERPADPVGPGREVELTAVGMLKGVGGPAKRREVIRPAIAHRAEGAHVEDRLARRGRRRAQNPARSHDPEHCYRETPPPRASLRSYPHQPEAFARRLIDFLSATAPVPSA